MKQIFSLTILAIILITGAVTPRTAKADYEGPMIVDVKKEIAELQAKLAELKAQKTAMKISGSSSSKVVKTAITTNTTTENTSPLATTEVTLESKTSFDLTGDQKIDGADLQTMLASWGTCTATCTADFTVDQKVDIEDLKILVANWYKK